MTDIPTERMTPQQVAADIAREFREDGKRWTQGDFARDGDGFGTVNVHSPRAVCWCLRGAIDRRQPQEDADATYAAFDAAIGRPWSGRDPDDSKYYFVDWNDMPGRTVAEVIALCDKVAHA